MELRVTIFRSILFVLSSFLFVTCVYHDTAAPNLCSDSDLHVQLDSVLKATSCSIKDGGIYVSVSGGVEPYSFYLNETEKTPGDFEGLGPGIYSVRIRDFNGCESTLTSIPVESEGVGFTTTFKPDEECLSDDGEITIDIMDGNPPYEYRVDRGQFGENNHFENLSHGAHTIDLRDNDDCIITLSLNVPRGVTGVSWINEIKPIMEQYCATSGCHNGTSRSNDFRKLSTVKFYSKQIRSKTQDRSMPFDESLTQDQIDLIACWIDDGMQEN